MKEGVIVSHFGVAVLIEEKENRQRSMVRVKRKSGVLVGDEVSFDDTIKKINSRKNLLARQTDFGVQDIAANIDALAIVVAPNPKTPATFIDLAIVSARDQNITPFLIVNKEDLGEHEGTFRNLSRIYSGEIEMFVTSCPHPPARAGELSRLRERRIGMLMNRLNEAGRTLFIGVSGSGKSSLVNMLVPEAKLAIGELEELETHGKHATTVSTMHHLKGGGELVDTPGVRDLKLVGISEYKIAGLFVGFGEYLKKDCRFRNCLHEHEPGCIVREAVHNDAGIAERYAVYLELLAQAKSHS